jgi:hypothetical protein
MEPDTCPPYWPRLIWWLIHHPHGAGDLGPIDKQLFNRLDAQYAAVAVAGLATHLSDKRVGGEVGELVGSLASNPMPGFSQLTAAR